MTAKPKKKSDPMGVDKRVAGAWGNDAVGTVVARYSISRRNQEQQVANVRRGSKLAIGVPLDRLVPAGTALPLPLTVEPLYKQLLSMLGEAQEA